VRAGRRAAVLLVVVGLIAAAVALDRDRDTTVEVGFGRSDHLVMPVAAPSSALGSTWFCPGGSAAGGDGVAEAVVTVANPGDRDATGTVTVFPSEGKQKVSPIEVAARTSVRVRLAEVVKAPWASALVEVDRGEVAVETSVAGPLGHGDAPCASAASEEWHLANGATTRDTGQVALLFNPFPDDAIVDFSFATDGGGFTAPDLISFPVPARSVVPVDLTQKVRRQAHVSTSVRARAGRLVMGRIQTYDGTGGPKGLDVALAAPSPAEQWWFPDGLKGAGIVEQYHVYNPTERPAEVALDVFVDKAIPELFELTLLPGTYATVDVSKEDAIPAKAGHSATVSSLNDVPVVAERSVAAGEGATRSGYASMLGAAGSARRWILAVGHASRALDEWVVIQNPGAEAVRVSLGALQGGRELPLTELQDLEIAPSGRRPIRIGEHLQRDELPLVVEADGPVVVERDLYSARGLGLSSAIGIPSSD
jgi:hypothetical protein